MITITINDKCIGCAKCVRLCPAHVLEMTTTADNKRKATVRNAAHCIDCSHCVSVCPEEAIEHSNFPQGTLTDINFDLYPSPEQLVEIIRGRRSNRAFTKKPVDPEKIDLLLQVAAASPTASNTRSVSCTVVTDPEVLRQISEFTVNTYQKFADMLENPFLKPILKHLKKDLYPRIPAFREMAEAFANGTDPVLRGATALIFFHAPAKSHFKSADSNIAYQNASLVAESMGLTHFYTGILLAAITQDKQKRINEILHIDGEIHAAMALGNRAFPITRRRK